MAAPGEIGGAPGSSEGVLNGIERPRAARELHGRAGVLQSLGIDGTLAACCALALAVPLLAAPEPSLLALASDDAFYYFKIARSIVDGSGSTFDGIAFTNGYHPLWMLFSVAAYALGGLDRLLPAAGLVWLAGAIGLATLVGVRRFVTSHSSRGYGALAVALLLSPPALAAIWNGMETSLALFTTWAAVAFADRRGALDPTRPLSDAAWLGLLLGAAFLARLDSVFLALAAGGLTLLSGVFRTASWSRILLRCSVMGAAFCSLAVPYLAWNLWSTGALMPISGSVKSTLPEIRNSLVLEGDSGFGLLLLGASWLALIPILVQDVRRTRSCTAAIHSPLLLLALACTGHFLHVYLWMSWGVHWWHFAVYGLLLALTLPIALARWMAAQPRAERLVWGGAVALACVSLALQVGQVQNRFDRHALWRDAATWAREHTDADAVFALKDAGLFAFFSNRRVVNLDGKANGLRYRDYLERGQVESYLSEVGVQYVADINGGCMDDGRCAVLILRPNRPGVYLGFAAGDEVYRSSTYAARFGGFSGPGVEPRFVIWRYSASSDRSAR